MISNRRIRDLIEKSQWSEPLAGPDFADLWRALKELQSRRELEARVVEKRILGKEGDLDLHHVLYSLYTRD